GRRAADARDRPRHRLLAASADAGRAVHGARTSCRRSHLRARGRIAPRRIDHPIGGAKGRRGGTILRFRLCSRNRPRGAGRDPRRASGGRPHQERVSRDVNKNTTSEEAMQKSWLTLSSLALAAALAAPGPAVAQQKDVEIALVVPLSGPWARQGVLLRMGAEMAIDDINNSGGIKSLG